MAIINAAHDFETGLKLSLNDLFHEWKLSLCLVFAIAGVVAPLLLLFGLKYGTFTTLRLRLIEDPKYREIIPLSTIDYQKDWFQQVGSRPDVAFLLPKTREIAVIVYVQLAAQAHTVESLKSELAALPKLDTIPTGRGDVLLLENGAKIPGESQCVLTRLAAETITAKRGDRLKCTIDRRRSGKHEAVSFYLDVIDVLPDRAGAVQGIFIPLSLVDAIETYRDGGAVQRYGWLGDVARIDPVFDGFALFLESPLPRQTQLDLTSATGLQHIREISSAALFDILDLPVASHRHNYLLYNTHSPVGFDSLNAVTKKLIGHDTILIPYIKPLKVAMAGSLGGIDPEMIIRGYWGTEETLAKLGLLDLPAFERQEKRRSAQHLLQVVVPDHLKTIQVGQLLKFSVIDGRRAVSFPVRVAAKKEEIRTALVPAELAGIVNTFLKQKRDRIYFDGNTNDFLVESHDYVSFRMYARGIDDVETLRLFLADQGIDALTKAPEIERIKSVDQGLTTIFWLVAVVGISGCLATLAASFASSVERKKRDLGIMRLMGISGWLIFQVPVSQALFIGVSGFATAAAAFFVISRVINRIFSQNLSSGGSMCLLEPSHFGIAILGTMSIVLLSSLFAAWQATRIDPADALRDE